MVDDAVGSPRTGGAPRLDGVHGIVLAGAYPNGQSPLDALVPRPLLPVAQRPLVTYALRFLRSGGLEDATLCVNSAARVVRQALSWGGELSMRLDFLEDWTPRGAAGCLHDAASRSDATTFVVVDGTTVPMLNLRKLLAAHRSSDAAMTVVVSRLDRPSGGAGGQRPTGVYVVDRSVLAHVPADGFQDIKEKLIPRLYRAGQLVRTYTASDVAPRAMSSESYLALEQWMLERLPDDPAGLDGYAVSGDSVVHHTAVVEAGARLLGPVLLGPRVSVRRGATIVGPASLGEGTTVGSGSVVSRSALWSGCDVGGGAFVDRCLLAEGARVAGGVSLFSALQVADGVRRPRGSRLAVALGERWHPVAANLRPSTTGHL